MDKQRKLRRDKGKDTHSRSVETNVFQKRSTQTFDIMTGEITMTQPEPLFRQTGVTVGLTRGGILTGVGYPGAFIEPNSGNMHGLYEGPIVGQMVTVGFLRGNSSAPIVLNRYPYQGKPNTAVSGKYILPMTGKKYDPTDVIIGHFSGSVIRFNTGIISGKLPGSVSFDVMTNLEISSLITKIAGTTQIELTSPTIKLSASTNIELNGTGDYATKFNALKTAFDQMKTDLNNFIKAYNGHANGTYGLSSPPAILSTADMSNAKAPKVTL